MRLNASNSHVDELKTNIWTTRWQQIQILIMSQAWICGVHWQDRKSRWSPKSGRKFVFTNAITTTKHVTKTRLIKGRPAIYNQICRVWQSGEFGAVLFFFHACYDSSSAERATSSSFSAIRQDLVPISNSFKSCWRDYRQRRSYYPSSTRRVVKRCTLLFLKLQKFWRTKTRKALTMDDKRKTKQSCEFCQAWAIIGTKGSTVKNLREQILDKNRQKPTKTYKNLQKLNYSSGRKIPCLTSMESRWNLDNH